MSMKQTWHIIGLQHNKELGKEIGVDYQVPNCETADEAIKIAKENGIKNITCVFMHSQLIIDWYILKGGKLWEELFMDIMF